MLFQADLLYENQKYDGSINRSYYAIFASIRALLALVKLDSSKHTGVISYFDRYFVKTGIFDKKFSKIAHSAFDSRHDNDYEDFYIPSKGESQKQLEGAKIFINEIEIKRQKYVNQVIDIPIIGS